MANTKKSKKKLSGGVTDRNPLHDEVYEMKSAKGMEWAEVFKLLEKRKGLSFGTEKERSAVRSGYYYRVREAEKKAGGGGVAVRDNAVKNTFKEIDDKSRKTILDRYLHAKQELLYTPAAAHDLVKSEFFEVAIPRNTELARIANHYHKTGKTNGAWARNGSNGNGSNGNGSNGMRLTTPSGVSMTFEGPKDEVAKIIAMLL